MSNKKAARVDHPPLPLHTPPPPPPPLQLSKYVPGPGIFFITDIFVAVVVAVKVIVAENSVGGLLTRLYILYYYHYPTRSPPPPAPRGLRGADSPTVTAPGSSAINSTVDDTVTLTIVWKLSRFPLLFSRRPSFTHCPSSRYPTVITESPESTEVNIIHIIIH